MKKALMLLVVLLFLFISVSPASAKKPHNCWFVDNPRIKAIEPETSQIKVPYLICAWPVGGGGYNVDYWLIITDTTMIKIDGSTGGMSSLTFDDLAVGQLIKYAFHTDELGQTMASSITIYPE